MKIHRNINMDRKQLSMAKIDLMISRLELEEEKKPMERIEREKVSEEGATLRSTI